MQEKLLSYEEEILSIVQEYLSQNRFFTMDDIVPYIQVRIKKTINLNQKGIRKILKSLIRKKKIVERSKFTHDDVLENDNREAIFDYIKSHPGTYFNQIAKHLGMSNYILAWHLKMLEQFEYIRITNIQNHDALFDTNMAPENDMLYFILSKEKSKDIINHLLENSEGISKTQLSKELRMHPNTVTKYIEELEEHGILLSKKLSRKTIYFVNERYYYQLMAF